MSTKIVDIELAQRSADWLNDRSADGGNGGYGPLAAAGLAIDFEIGRWEVERACHICSRGEAYRGLMDAADELDP